MTDEIDLGIEGLSDYKKIGSGGFAVVYSAAEENLGRRVAVKVLDAIDDAGQRRFDRERLSMGKASDHPNIVVPLRSGYTNPGKNPYLVMEYLDGGSLQDRLDSNGPLRLAEALDIALPIADALGDSHGHGILHKDVKPANILLSRSGIPKLSDFGIATIRDATYTSQIAYSLAYAAPETFDFDRSTGGQIIDPRDECSDLYSLAATFYALITGAPPFESPSPAGLMRQIVADPVPTVGDKALDKFLETALAKRPEERYRTAAQIIDALSALRTAETQIVSRPLQPPVPSPVEKDTRRWKPRYLAAAAIVVAAASGTFVLNLADNRREDPDNIVETTLTTAEAAEGASTLPPEIDPEETSNPISPVEFYTGHRDNADGSSDDTVNAIVQLNDGRVASGGAGEVRIWDPAEPETTEVVYSSHEWSVRTVLLLSDGRIASVGSESIHVWDPALPDSAGVHMHSTVVTSAIELRDGRIVSSSTDGAVHIWDPDFPAVTQAAYTGHSGKRVTGLIQLNDGRIASGDASLVIQIWDPEFPTRTQSTYVGHTEPPDQATQPGSVGSVELVRELDDGSVLSYGGHGEHTFQIWHPSDTARTRTTATSGYSRLSIALQDGRTAHAWDNRIVIESGDSSITDVYPHHLGRVTALVQLGDGRVASGSTDGTVHVWDLRSL